MPQPYQRKVHKRCAACSDVDHSHEFTFRLMKDKDGFWCATGPYATEAEAKAVLDGGADLIEKQNNEHIA